MSFTALGDSPVGGIIDNDNTFSAVQQISLNSLLIKRISMEAVINKKI